jgi:hypothetical protein
MHELQLLLGVESHLAGEREPPLLGEDAGVAELLHVLDSWHALHHLLVADLLEVLEVEVPKALVLLPSIVVTAGYKAHGLCHLHVENVEAVGTSVHLSKKATMVIPDP